MGNKLELTWFGKDKEIKIEPRILIENKELSNTGNDAETENMLIHGDNLLALKALEAKYTGKIKCVYIDPPYNTGSAFEHYDDNLEHSTWLSLMKPRLEILRNLLSDDGVIFIQIDSNEHCYLKVLLDEIFGRNNFIVDLVWRKKTGGGQDSEFFVIERENILAELFIKKKAISNFDSNFDEENAQVSINNFSDYKFVKRFAGVKVVSQEFFKSFISDLIDESVLNVVNLKASNLYKILKKNKIYDDSKSIVNNLKNILLTQANLLFKVDNVILDKKQDNYDGKSFGANSTIYFDILSSDNSGGIYFVDQPEDDVSQLAVSKKILKYFKKISSHKQIILVTHNPQFVVNLDVDNVICIDRDKGGKINFKSGALEYISKEYNVLDFLDYGRRGKGVD